MCPRQQDERAFCNSVDRQIGTTEASRTRTRRLQAEASRSTATGLPSGTINEPPLSGAAFEAYAPRSRDFAILERRVLNWRAWNPTAAHRSDRASSGTRHAQEDNRSTGRGRRTAVELRAKIYCESGVGLALSPKSLHARPRRSFTVRRNCLQSADVRQDVSDRSSPSRRTFGCRRATGERADGGT